MALVVHRRLALPLWVIGFLAVGLTAPPPATLLVIAALAIARNRIGDARGDSVVAYVSLTCPCPPVRTPGQGQCGNHNGSGDWRADSRRRADGEHSGRRAGSHSHGRRRRLAHGATAGLTVSRSHGFVHEPDDHRALALVRHHLLYGDERTRHRIQHTFFQRCTHCSRLLRDNFPRCWCAMRHRQAPLSVSRWRSSQHQESSMDSARPLVIAVDPQQSNSSLTESGPWSRDPILVSQL